MLPGTYVWWTALRARRCHECPRLQHAERRVSPPEFAARANTALNLLMFGGGFVAQWGIGLCRRRGACGYRPRRGAADSRFAFSLVLVLEVLAYAWFALGWRRHAPYSHAAPWPQDPRAPMNAMHLHILGICGTFHGWHRRHRQSRRVQGDRLRRQRLSADEHAARSARHRAHRGLRRRRSCRAWRAARTCSSSATRCRAATRSSRRSSTPGLPYQSGPQWLFEHVLHDKWVLAVAGTHGKTTATSMLAWILDHAGTRPGFPDRRRAARTSAFPRGSPTARSS